MAGNEDGGICLIQFYDGTRGMKPGVWRGAGGDRGEKEL